MVLCLRPHREYLFEKNKNEIELLFLSHIRIVSSNSIELEQIKLTIDATNLSFKKALIMRSSNQQDRIIGELQLLDKLPASLQNILNLKPLHLSLVFDEKTSKNKDYIVDLKGLLALDLDQVTTYRVPAKSSDEEDFYTKLKENYSDLIYLGQFFIENKMDNYFQLSVTGQIFSNAAPIVVSNSMENYD